MNAKMISAAILSGAALLAHSQGFQDPMSREDSKQSVSGSDVGVSQRGLVIIESELSFREDLLQKKRELEKLTVEADIKKKQDEIEGKDKVSTEPNILNLPGSPVGSGIPVVPPQSRGLVAALGEPLAAEAPPPPPPPPSPPSLTGVIGNKAFFVVEGKPFSATPGGGVGDFVLIEILNSKEVVVERAGSTERRTLRSSI